MTKPTVTLPSPPSQHEIVPPATPETSPPVQPETPMPVLEVAWEEIKLPPLNSTMDVIRNIIVENGGNTISIYREIGPANNGEASLFSHWKSKDGGKTWNEVEKLIITPEEQEQLGFVPTGWSGSVCNQSLGEEVLKSFSDPLTDFSNPFAVSKNPNNPNDVLLIAWCTDTSLVEKYPGLPSFARLFLSLDGNWYQVNFPPCFIPYDAYPETPQLTLLKGAFPSFVAIRIISTDDGSIELFMTHGSQVFSGRIANLKSPN
jgi:hypothetical protein